MSDKIIDKIAVLPEGSTYFSLEFFPPKTQAGAENFFPRLQRLASLSPLFVTVTWGAGGSTAAKSLDLALLTQQKLGLTTCLHLTCTNMSKDVLDHALEECKRAGIRNILALRGDEPRQEEYGISDSQTNGVANGHEGEGANVKFEYATDLVRYIREQHGDYFCIGVAAYPEGHACNAWPCTQSPEQDLPHLLEKTEAGADFIMTQLFYSTESFLKFEKLLREHESGAWKEMPIIPGLMPVQSWSTVKRVTKLCSINIPTDIAQRLEHSKGDDEGVKRIGVEVLSKIVSRIQKDGLDSKDTLSEDREQVSTRFRGKQGFHFYTLNLEKSVATILERTRLFVPPAEESEVAIDDSADGTPEGASIVRTKSRRRLSSANSNPRNRAIVRSYSSSKVQTHEVLDSEAGVLKDLVPSRSVNLAVAEGEGSLGREATWDDFPNGRWGDARSPAYGSIDGYGPSLHVSHAEALRLWGKPQSAEDISNLFRKYLMAELSGLPWSEESLSEETTLIRDQLLALNERGWWTVASQPAVNGARSSDPVVGWGPQNYGFVYQKPFVELFLPSSDWQKLKTKLESQPDEVMYFAGNAMGEFECNDETSVNPVTWGTFKGREIATPTIIEAVSFREWQDEAFGIWRVWERVHPATSPSAKFLRKTIEDIWLVNVIGHDYVQGDKLWKLLLS